MTRVTTRGAIVRLAVSAAVAAVLLSFVVVAIQRPVAEDTSTYRALFTDVGGLETGDDVRLYGVQVGKVTSIDLADGQGSVEFTLDSSRHLYDSSVLSIRYQTLIGQRYIDIDQPDRDGPEMDPATTVDAAHTIPSFDVTQLFNGLEPIFDELSPESLNRFAENALAVIQGDGSGIGPALGAMQKLTDYVSDRQAVISTIVANLGTISDQIGGRSPHLLTMLNNLRDVVAELDTKVDRLIFFTLSVPSTIGTVNNLLKTLGLTQGSNPDLDSLLPPPDVAVEVLGQVPALLQSMAALLPEPGSAVPADMSCSRGDAPVPGILGVLVEGQRISVCNP